MLSQGSSLPQPMDLHPRPTLAPPPRPYTHPADLRLHRPRVASSAICADNPLTPTLTQGKPGFQLGGGGGGSNKASKTGVRGGGGGSGKGL